MSFAGGSHCAEPLPALEKKVLEGLRVIEVGALVVAVVPIGPTNVTERVSAPADHVVATRLTSPVWKF
jgi:hypothetical protein